MFHGIGFLTGCGALQVIPRLRLATIFRCITTALVRTTLRVKAQDVDGRRTEACHCEIMRDNKAVIRSLATPVSNALGCLIILLLQLLRPRKKETTALPVFKQ